MKNTILIIEDNAYRAFTTKTVLESFLRLEVEFREITKPSELDEIVAGRQIEKAIVTPKGSVADLASTLKSQGYNRRNITIIVVCIDDCEIGQQLSLAA